MTDFKLTPEHAKHLTTLIGALRPDWDRPGIADAIWRAKDRSNAIEVCAAAIRACTPLSRTPAVIPMDGNHWRETTTKPTSAATLNASAVRRCPDCSGYHSPACQCDPPEHERSHGRGADMARAALAALPTDVFEDDPGGDDEFGAQL